MTEDEWLACAGLEAMLEFLRGKASDRKMLLFAIACCRRVWHIIGDDPTDRKAVETAEQFTDGEVSLAEFRTVVKSANHYPAALLALHDLVTVADRAAYFAAQTAELTFSSVPPPQLTDVNAYARLLVDIIGPSPFRPITIAPAWLTWREGVVPKIARSIHEERCFDRMPVLGDALEEAGCNSADILSHCRSGTEHVRGCWVVDAILGKS